MYLYMYSTFEVMALNTHITEHGFFIALLEINFAAFLFITCSPLAIFPAAPSQPQDLRLFPTGAFSVRLEFTPAPHVYPNPEATSYVAYYCALGNAPEQRPGTGAANACSGGAQAPRRLQVLLADIEKGTHSLETSAVFLS